MPSDSFSKRQEQAVEQMREMSRRANGGYPNMPPAPPFVKIPNNTNNQNKTIEKTPSREEPTPKPHTNDGITDLLSGMNLPFLNNLKSDGDMGLILGLLLILISEKSDRLLMLALLYILM